MKKLLIILLSAVMIFTFTACNEETEDTENTTEIGLSEQVNEDLEKDTEELEEPVDDTDEDEKELIETEEATSSEEIQDTGDQVVPDEPDVESIPIATSYNWMGEYNLAPGTYILEFGPKVSDFMSIGFIKLDDISEDPQVYAGKLFALEDRENINLENEIAINEDKVYTLEMGDHFGQFGIVIEDAGRYAIVTENTPDETGMVLLDMNGEELTSTTQY